MDPPVGLALLVDLSKESPSPSKHGDQMPSSKLDYAHILAIELPPSLVPQNSSSSQIGSGSGDAPSIPVGTAHQPVLQIGDLGDILTSRVADAALRGDEEARAQSLSSEKSDVQLSESVKIGRLGPAVVTLDEQSAVGGCVIGDDNLQFESKANFVSIRANACVNKGKWMYEVILETDGIQQLGWATRTCPFTNEEGVGDSPDSYAYDGKRKKKWSVSCSSYGKYNWAAGDVITCLIDLDKGEISYKRNGTHLGTAFRSVRCGSKAYFPAVSLSHGERCRFNFGSLSLRFPEEGYRPIQPPRRTVLRSLSTAGYLCECLLRLLVASRERELTDDVVILAGLIFDHLGLLVGADVVVAEIILPFMVTIYTMKDSPSPSKDIGRLLQLFVLCLEEHELAPCVDSLMFHLSLYVRSENFNRSYMMAGPVPYLRLAVEITSNITIRRLWMESPRLGTSLEGLLTTKQHNSEDIGEIFADVWWKGESTEEGAKDRFASQSADMRDRFHDVHLLHARLLGVFLEDAPPGLAVEPHNLLGWWLESLRERRGSGRAGAANKTVDPSVFDHVYFVLLSWLQPCISSNSPPVQSDRRKDTEVSVSTIEDVSPAASSFPIAIFADPSRDAPDAPRFGGTVSHLRKVLQVNVDDLRQQQPHDGFGKGTALEKRFRRSKREDSPVESFATYILDIALVFYQSSVTSTFKQACYHLQAQMQAIAQLDETERRIKRSLVDAPGVTEHLRLARQVFRDDVIEHVRTCAWYRSLLFRSDVQTNMYNMCLFLHQLFHRICEDDVVTAYVPEHYAEAMVDTFHSLRRGDPPYPLTSELEPRPLLSCTIDFLVRYVDDKRLVNPDLRDLLLQSVSVLLQYNEYVREFERNSTAQSKLVVTMLKMFDARFWIPVNNILLRFWRGYGFAQDEKRSLDCSSVYFQRSFQAVCRSQPTVLKDFINFVFNNLNWTLTEFVVALEEINSSISSMSPDVEQFQRKCSIMYELSVNLLRLLEVVAREVPELFLQGDDINMTRLVELVLTVVNRTTKGRQAELFHSIMKRDLPGLEKLSQTTIVAPAAGILRNLSSAFDPKMDRDIKEVIYACEAAVCSEAMEHLCSISWPTGSNSKPTVSAEECDELKAFVDATLAHVKRRREETEASATDTIPEDDLCSICFTNRMDTKLEPCNHTTCARCINRHLLNNKRCFFCNTDVTGIIPWERTKSVERENL